MWIAVLIAAYAAIAVVVYVFLGGAQLPPCFGRVPDGQISQACYEMWLAERPWIAWFGSTPYPEVAGFLVATGATIWLARRRRA
jgi:hypothetical protein